MRRADAGAHSATNENTSGGAQAFTIGASGALSGAVATVASGGADPAYLLPLSSGGIAIMNVRPPRVLPDAWTTR